MIKIIRRSTWRNVMDHIQFLKLVVYRHQLFIRKLGDRHERDILWAGREWE